MFRAMFRNLLCQKGGCCHWLFLRRRQPLHEDDDGDFVVDPDMNTWMSQPYRPSVPEEVPSGNISALPDGYEHMRTLHQGSDVTKQNLKYSSDQFVVQVQRLAAEERGASRLLACKLLHTIYGHCSPTVKDDLGVIFERLCKDEDIFVRRMALSTLKYFAREADFKFYDSHVAPILESFVVDKAGLRLEAAHVLIALFKTQQLSDRVYHLLLPVFLKYAKDRYWQVRFIIANSISDVLKSVTSPKVKSCLLELLTKFSKDSERKIRMVAHRQKRARLCTLLASVRNDLSFIQENTPESTRSGVLEKVC